MAKVEASTEAAPVVPAVEKGPRPLTRAQEQAYRELYARVVQQAKVAKTRASGFEKEKQLAAKRDALLFVKADNNALKLIKSCMERRQPDPPEYRTEERGYTVTKFFEDIQENKVRVTAVKATLDPPIKSTMIRVLYDVEEANGEAIPVDGSEGKGNPASPEYNFTHEFRIERPTSKGWKSFERKLCRRKLFTFQVVEKGWFGKETVKGAPCGGISVFCLVVLSYPALRLFVPT
jgi:hypothetical protein